MILIQIARKDENVDKFRNIGKDLVKQFVLEKIPRYTEGKKKDN